LGKIDADALTLWKVSLWIVSKSSLKAHIFGQVSVPPENRQTVLEGCKDPDKINGAQKLDATIKLSKIFAKPVDEHLHIVVQCSDSEQTGEERRDQVSALQKSALVFFFLSIPDKLHSTGFHNVISRILKAQAPANSSKSLNYTKSQVTYSIYDGRYKVDMPRTSVSLPVQLFHPAFGHFLDHLKNDDIPPDDTVRKTTEYMKASSAIYTTEAERREVLTPLLCRILGVNIQMIQNADLTIPDGIVEVGTNEARSLLLVKEDKKEFGDGGSDPSTQAGLSVGRCWAQSRVCESIIHCISFLLFIP
jgi:hypothetical protein